MRALGVAVAVQLLLQRQQHGEGVLSDGLAVGPGGVGEDRMLIQHARHDIGIGPRGVKLQQAQPR